MTKYPLLSTARTHLWEWVRCARHNTLHLRRFRVSYRAGAWCVREGELELSFPYYPYLAFHDIEGYLRDGAWNLDPGMTVLDAGGCNGEFALYAAKRVGPSGRVLMLEPDANNVAVAERVFAMNGNPSNIEIIPAGLWSKPDKLRFSTGHSAQSAVVRGPGSEGAGVVEIDVHSLPSLARRFNLQRLDFVKMDIEGAELEAVSAAADLPAGLKPRYAIASYHVVDGRPTAETLPDIFARIGYRCTVGHPRHLTTWASPPATA